MNKLLDSRSPHACGRTTRHDNFVVSVSCSVLPGLPPSLLRAFESDPRSLDITFCLVKIAGKKSIFRRATAN